MLCAFPNALPNALPGPNTWSPPPHPPTYPPIHTHARTAPPQEAESKRKQLEALAHTPPSEWLRQIQLACTQVLRGASVTVAPESSANLTALLGVLGMGVRLG